MPDIFNIYIFFKNESYPKCIEIKKIKQILKYFKIDAYQQ
jgi:hypothetical protein